MTKFPDTIYVKEEKDGDDTWFTAYPNPADHADKDAPTRVGVYKFIETKKVELTITLK